MKGKYAQISMEYLILVGFVTMVVIVMMLASNYYTKKTDDSVVLNQAEILARSIIDSAESVYYYGAPSKTTIKANIPERIEQITIGNNHVEFVVRVAGGTTSISKYTDINITGSLSSSPGLRHIQIQSKGSFVNVSQNE